MGQVAVATSVMKPAFSMTGLAFGAIALLVAVTHFWAAPIAPKRPIEQIVADKVVAIRDTTLARLRGREIPAPAPPPPPEWTMDRALGLAAPLMGALAVVLGVLGFVRREPARACGGAALLGAAALAFQFAMVAIGAIVLCMLVAAVMNMLPL